LGQWVETQNAEEVFICDVGIAEFPAGEPIGDENKRTRFLDFWSSFVSKLPSLPLDRKVCERAGALLFIASTRRRTVPLDALHGAVAQIASLEVLCTDTEHFSAMGIPARDPTRKVR